MNPLISIELLSGYRPHGHEVRLYVEAEPHTGIVHETSMSPDVCHVELRLNRAQLETLARLAATALAVVDGVPA